MAMGPAPLPSIGLVLGPQYALASAVGAFTLSGLDATLTEAGTLGQSGAPAPFPSLGLVLAYTPNRSLAADAGAFGLDAAPSLSDLALTGERATYTLAGQDAILAFGRASLVGAAGSFTITGQFATLTGANEYRLVGEAAAYQLDGVAVPLVPSRTFYAAGEAFAVGGIDAGFARGLRLSAAVYPVTVAGMNATLNRSSATATWGKRGRRGTTTTVRRTNTVF